MNTQRTKAVKVAQTLIDEGGMTTTYSDLEWMSDDKLFKLLNACGFWWNGDEWVDDSN